MQSDLRPSRRVLEFAQAFGVVTPALASRVAGGDASRAKLLLAQLSTSGKLFRHLCRYSASPKRFAYYATCREPLPLTRVRAAYATASFVARSTPSLRLVSSAEFEALMEPIAREARADMPRYRPCFLRLVPGQAARVSLIWPARSRDMNDVIRDLDLFVSHRAFAPWRALALAGQLEITCLFRSFRGAAELQRWLERRPLLSRAGGPPVPVPVTVRPAAMLRG